MCLLVYECIFVLTWIGQWFQNDEEIWAEICFYRILEMSKKTQKITCFILTRFTLTL